MATPNVPHFFQPDPNNSFDMLVCSGLNTFSAAALAALRNEANRFLGLSAVSSSDQIALNMSKIRLAMAETQAVKAKLISEKTVRLLDLRIAAKETELEKSRHALELAQTQSAQLQLPAGTEMIRGALELTANAEGITGQPEQIEGFNAWQEGIGQGGRVQVIVGGRGSGKTCFGAKEVEYAHAAYSMPAFWLGLPPEAREWLPNWIAIIEDPAKLPMGCVVLIDESGLDYCSLLFNTAKNRFMRALLMITRHRHCTLIFCVQSSADLDLAVIRAADSLIFKKLALNQVETERPSLRRRAAKAETAFKGLSKMEALESAYVFDSGWEGMITFSPPSFWSESLSCAYAYKDLTDIQQQVAKENELKRVVVEESHQLEEGALDTQILQLRRDGNGIEAISKRLSCSSYRVRRVLEPIERQGGCA